MRCSFLYLFYLYGKRLVEPHIEAGIHWDTANRTNTPSDKEVSLSHKYIICIHIHTIYVYIYISFMHIFTHVWMYVYIH